MGCSTGTAQTEVVIDESNASASIQVSGRAFVSPPEDLYNGVQTTRWNRSRFHRLGTAYTPTYVTFDAIGIPGGTGIIGVVVNNQPFATVHVVNTDVMPRRYTVTGMPAGAKTVDLYEDFQERVTNLNLGVDGRVAGCYVTRVLMPANSGGVIAKVTAPNAIVLFGDSHIDGDATAPESVNGWGGQLRRAALARGNWIVGYAGAGSSTACGDGPDALETAQEEIDLLDDMGAVNPHLLMMRRPNDRAYFDFPGADQHTAAQYGTFIATMIDTVRVAYPTLRVIFTRIPQGTAQTAATTTAGENNQDYWDVTVAVAAARPTWVTARDGVTEFDLNTATCFVEGPVNGVHLDQVEGHDVIAPVVIGWYGL